MRPWPHLRFSLKSPFPYDRELVTNYYPPYKRFCNILPVLLTQFRSNLTSFERFGLVYTKMILFIPLIEWLLGSNASLVWLADFFSYLNAV